jgi:hypothetical protein
MFEKLKSRWNVNNTDLLLILCTFALGGSLCGRAGQFLLAPLFETKGFVFWICYLLTVTLLWPLCVLLVSIPLGQYRFFTNYLKKIWKRISGKGNRSGN